jgi:hypothetical protein
MISTPALASSAAYSKTPFGMRPKIAEVNREIFAVNKSLPPDFIQKGGHHPVIVSRSRIQETKTVSPPRLLRQRSERPSDTRARKRDELAPPHVVSPHADTLLSCRLAFFCRARASDAPLTSD